MIRVERGDPPAGFEERVAELTRRFTEARNQDPALTAAKFWQRVRPELRADAAELARRFHDKCAFCEARQLLIWCLQEDAPFCAMTRAYLAREAPKLANPVRPHPRVSEADGLNRIAQLVAEYREETRQLV